MPQTQTFTWTPKRSEWFIETERHWSSDRPIVAHLSNHDSLGYRDTVRAFCTFWVRLCEGLEIREPEHDDPFCSACIDHAWKQQLPHPFGDS